MKRDKLLLGISCAIFFTFSQQIFSITNTWSIPEDIPNVNLTGVDPKMAMDGDGNAILLWQAGSDQLQASRFSKEEQQWQEIKTLDTSPVPGREFSDYWVAVDSAGNAIFCWAFLESDTQLIFGVKATYYDASQSWNDWSPVLKTIVTNWDPFPYGDPNSQAAISDDGTAIILWGVANFTNATLFDKNNQVWNTWIPANFTKNNFPPYGNFAGLLYETYVAMDDQGRAIFVLGEDPTRALYATYFDKSVDWLTWNPATSLKQIDPNSTVAPFCVMNSQGNIAFEWQSTSTVKATFFDQGVGTWASWAPSVKIIGSTGNIFVDRASDNHTSLEKIINTIGTL